MARGYDSSYSLNFAGRELAAITNLLEVARDVPEVQVKDMYINLAVERIKDYMAKVCKAKHLQTGLLDIPGMADVSVMKCGKQEIQQSETQVHPSLPSSTKRNKSAPKSNVELITRKTEYYEDAAINAQANGTPTADHVLLEPKISHVFSIKVPAASSTAASSTLREATSRLHQLTSQENLPLSELALFSETALQGCDQEIKQEEDLLEREPVRMPFKSEKDVTESTITANSAESVFDEQPSSEDIDAKQVSLSQACTIRADHMYLERDQTITAQSTSRIQTTEDHSGATQDRPNSVKSQSQSDSESHMIPTTVTDYPVCSPPKKDSKNAGAFCHVCQQWRRKLWGYRCTKCMRFWKRMLDGDSDTPTCDHIKNNLNKKCRGCRRVRYEIQCRAYFKGLFELSG